MGIICPPPRDRSQLVYYAPPNPIIAPWAIHSLKAYLAGGHTLPGSWHSVAAVGDRTTSLPTPPASRTAVARRHRHRVPRPRGCAPTTALRLRPVVPWSEPGAPPLSAWPESRHAAGSPSQLARHTRPHPTPSRLRHELGSRHPRVAHISRTQRQTTLVAAAAAAAAGAGGGGGDTWPSPAVCRFRRLPLGMLPCKRFTLVRSCPSAAPWIRTRFPATTQNLGTPPLKMER